MHHLFAEQSSFWPGMQTRSQEPGASSQVSNFRLDGREGVLHSVLRRLHCLHLCARSLPNCILIVRSKQTQLSANNFSWMRDKQTQKIARNALSGFSQLYPRNFHSNSVHLQAEKIQKKNEINKKKHRISWENKRKAFQCKFVFWLWLREPLMVFC